MHIWKGEKLFGRFQQHSYAAERQTNLYYPFASKEEWELTLFLLLSSLSMANITKCLSLRLVCSFEHLQSPAFELIMDYLGAATSALLQICQGPSLMGRNASEGSLMEVQAMGHSSTDQMTSGVVLLRCSQMPSSAPAHSPSWRSHPFHPFEDL